MSSFDNRFSRKLREHCAFVNRAVFKGLLYQIDWYPGAIDGEGNVHGELYSFTSPNVLSELDEYEECSPAFPEPHEYRREKRAVTTLDEQTVNAWIWLYNRSITNLEPIPDGIFKMTNS